MKRPVLRISDFGRSLVPLPHTFPFYVPLVCAAVVLLLAGCAIHRVETAKSLYEKAMEADSAGKDLESVVYWKALAARCDREIEQGHYVSTNRFLRATARTELGLWDEAQEDLKQIEPGSLREEESWIYPLYLVMQGDAYASGGMPDVASNFYHAVLNKSSNKNTGVYLLALEREINTSILSIQQHAAGEADPAKYRSKEYDALARDVLKYVEEIPFSSVPHYLLADLLAKNDIEDRAVEHVLAALEMGLPSQDLRRSAEYLLATLAGSPEMNGRLKSAVLHKASVWWQGEPDSIFRAGEDDAARIRQLDPSIQASGRVRWLAVSREGGLRILLWEPVDSAPTAANQ